MNGRLPLKQGSYRTETCTQHVSDHPHAFNFAASFFIFFQIFVSVKKPSDVVFFVRDLRGYAQNGRLRVLANIFFLPALDAFIPSSVPLKIVKQQFGQD